jgi:hypothetical protein
MAVIKMLLERVARADVVADRRCLRLVWQPQQDCPVDVALAMAHQPGTIQHLESQRSFLADLINEFVAVAVERNVACGH